MVQQYNVKELPYGVSDFLTVVNDNLYFVDKSMYIPQLEREGRNLFFIRPRRFGKSIFVSMLHAYYDCKTTLEQFQKWFGNLWIGERPTALQGKFMVLHLDFSQVGGTIDSMQENFNVYCGAKFDYFVDYYNDIYSEEFIASVHNAKDANAKLTLINLETERRKLSLYLIIDEYDNFTNTILNE